MAELKASEVKYGVPLKASVGDLYLTATQIELPAEAEYVEGGFELDKTKLGLPVEGVSGTTSASREATVGATASTTALPALALITRLVKAKEANESGKQVAESFIADVTSIKGKLIVRIYVQEKAEAGKAQIEPKTATKVNIGLFTATVIVLGK